MLKRPLVTRTFLKTNAKLRNILLSNLKIISFRNKWKFYVAIINFLLLVNYMELPCEQFNSQTHVKVI